MSKSKETMTKKQQDDLASTLNNIPWGLPLGFPSMPPFGTFPPLGLSTSNFPSLNSFPSSAITAGGFPSLPLPSLMSNDSANSNSTTDLWANALSNPNTTIDYNEYVKQLGSLMNAFNERSQIHQSTASPTMKSSKSKRTTSSGKPSSSDSVIGKVSTSKLIDESRPTSTSSSSTSSRRSPSNQNPTKSSHRSSSNNPTKSSTSSRTKSHQNSNSTKTSTNNDSTMLDPLSFTAATNGSLAFPYFLPPLLSQTSSSSSTTTTTPTNTNPSSMTYPFSNLSSSLLNPAATLYPFLSPDWFASSSKSIDGFANLASMKSLDSKETTSQRTSQSKQQSSSSTNESSSTSRSKKRAKSIRVLSEEQDLNRDKTFPNNQLHKSASTNPSLLHSALTDPNTGNGLRDNLLNLSRQNSLNDHSSHRQTPLAHSADESRSNDEDDSESNTKRRKIEEVNEALVRLPLHGGWKRVTIVRAITRTGVRGDVSYYAPCGRKLRSFQEIDRYLSKKKITNLDRSHFTFSSKVHIGYFHEPREGPDGKTNFHESNEDEIITRILEINPKFQRNKCDYDNEIPSKTSSISSPSVNQNNGTHEFHHQSGMIQQIYEENRQLHLEQEEMSKRAADIKKKREAMHSSRNVTNDSVKTAERQINSPYQHNDFLKAIIEQQKLVQQQELEHQQKLQYEQQEQEHKRQEMAYLKQIELKKRQDEKLLLLEQRKLEKNAQREKKIQEKYTEIILAKEMKRITDDMQLRDLKPLPMLTPVDNTRLSIEAFANALMIIEFLNNFKEILHLPDSLIPTLNSFQQMNSRDINSLCQILLHLALEDPGIPNPKKGLTNLGQKLSEIDITEHTFSEILRLYIRERNGFDEKITQSLSDTSFQSLVMDDKIEILAFLCNDLSASKRIVEETDRQLDELIVIKHEKLEIEKRLRRLRFDKANQTSSNNVKKLATLIREKDLNSSDNESPDESETESMKNYHDISINLDSGITDDQDIDESKIEDFDKRLTFVTRKYTLMKRRVIAKQSRTRALHLGQDRYRRRYWYFSQLSGIYIEGLRTGDISSNDIKDTVENAAKQRLEKRLDGMNGESNPISRPSARKRQQTKTSNAPVSAVVAVEISEQSIPTEVAKIVNDNEDEQLQPLNSSDRVTEDLSTMDLSSFCLPVKRNEDDDDDEDENDEQKMPKIKPDESYDVKTEANDNSPENKNDNLPLDLSCSKTKRPCHDDYWTSQHVQAASLLPTPMNKFDQCHELNGASTKTILWNNIKQENILELTNTNKVKQESANNHLKQIEQTIRDKFQYSQPFPIPDDVQYGWWTIQTSDELRCLITSLARRGHRERYLCRMLQRYFDVIINSMINHHSTSNGKCEPSTTTDIDNDHDEQQASTSNDLLEHDQSQFDDTHEMDVVNEIYNLSDRIIASSFHCRAYDINNSRQRLTYSDIQTKGSDILDEAKHLLVDIERHIERRYLKHPFVRRSELTASSVNRLHPTLENSGNEMTSSPKYDEVPQQLERWRRTVNESRTPAQLALCLTQLERCIAWERSLMRVYCEICHSDADEEKLLLCDGCDHGTHTYCIRPPMSFIPPNDWYCFMCIGKAKGESLCFVCGNKGEQQLNRCEPCGKLFHEDCLKNAKQQRGKWLCVLCAANDSTSASTGLTVNNKSSIGRQKSRSTNSRQSHVNSTVSHTNGDSVSQSSSNNNNNNRSRSATKRKKSKTINHEVSIVHETHSNSSHTADTTTPVKSLNDSSSVHSDDDVTSPAHTETTQPNRKKKSTRPSKLPNDLKACRMILDELLKSDVSWPFQTAVDPKENPEYYECIKHPMDFATMKKKMRNHHYKERDAFSRDVELILNNCEYYNEDDSPVGQAGHVLRGFFQTQWTKQFG